MLGTALGMMGVIPGGPLVGLMVGSVVYFIGRSDRFQSLIFGRSQDSEGNETSNITKFIKKRIPTIAGGLIGLTGMLGFGPITGVILGSAIGFATKSKKFQELIFGVHDENGDLKNVYCLK